MAIVRYCWRCQVDVPMLTEREWKKVHPLLLEDKDFIMQKRRELNLTLDEVLSTFRAPSCQKYFEITGFEIGNPNAIWHHRNRDLGEDCHECGKPLRTPRAKLCAACGAPKVPPGSGSRRPEWAGFAWLAGLFTIALFSIPNLFERHSGFSSSRGFPLPFATWRDYGPPFEFFYPWRIGLNVLAILGLGLATAYLMGQAEKLQWVVRRSWVFIAAVIPFVLFSLGGASWIATGQSLLGLAVCVWLIVLPSPLPWALVTGCYASWSVMTVPTIFLLDDGGLPMDPVEWKIFAVLWISSSVLTWGLYLGRPHQAGAR